jgi:hypothetical protein
MRLVLGSESVADSVDRTLEALLLWSEQASLLELQSGWQEQQVYVWGGSEKGSSVSLIHSILLRANRDELRPNLQKQPIPSLHVTWVPVEDVETGTRQIDAEARPGVLSALQALRTEIQVDPENVLRYLADMKQMSSASPEKNSWRHEMEPARSSRDTLPLSVIKEPAVGDGTLTLAEASLLYRAFLGPDAQIDFPGLRKRLLATQSLEELEEKRPIRGYKSDRPRMNLVYRYLG